MPILDLFNWNSAVLGVLRVLLRGSDLVVESDYIQEQGRALFREAVALGLEGIMVKALASPQLLGRRSRHRLKINPRGRVALPGKLSGAEPPGPFPGPGLREAAW